MHITDNSPCLHPFDKLAVSPEGALHCRCGETWHANRAAGVITNSAREAIGALQYQLNQLFTALETYLALAACSQCCKVCDKANASEGVFLKGVGEYICFQCIGEKNVYARHTTNASEEEIVGYQHEIATWFRPLNLTPGHYIADRLRGFGVNLDPA